MPMASHGWVIQAARLTALNIRPERNQTMLYTIAVVLLILWSFWGLSPPRPWAVSSTFFW